MIKFELACLYCKSNSDVDIIEYGETTVKCNKCSKEQVVIYSKDYVEDYNDDCWYSYWVEEIKGENNG